MAYFGKLFVLNKTENLDGFIRSMKLSKEDTEKFISASEKGSQKLVKNGDVYTLTYTFGDKTTEVQFKNGVEFQIDEEGWGVTKNIVTVDGDKFTQVQKYQDGNVATFVSEFSPNQLVLTITSNFWDGTAKEYFVAQ